VSGRRRRIAPPAPGLRWPLRSGAARDGGQATVEAVAMLPLVVLVALALGQALAARSAASLAGGAAQAGAVAMLQERDPAAAARGALGDRDRAAATIRVDGTRVTVRVRPRSVLPAVAGLLAATATADAGPEAR
jgi:pilus assembly protein CpaE